MLSISQQSSKVIRPMMQHVLAISAETGAFLHPTREHFANDEYREVLLAGARIEGSGCPESDFDNYRKSTGDFCLKSAVEVAYYREMLPYLKLIAEHALLVTDGFKVVDHAVLKEYPEIATVVIRALGFAGKHDFKFKTGIPLGAKVSKRAAEKISELVAAGPVETNIEVLAQGLTQTLEGISRSDFSKNLMEPYVEEAIRMRGLDCVGEKDIAAIEGLVFKGKPDFAIFVDGEPKVVMEVRHGDPRHSVGYAKDKSFSAADWRAKFPDCLFVMMTGGGWSKPTMELMAKAFDYVLPIASASTAADVATRHLAGDRTLQRSTLRLVE